MTVRFNCHIMLAVSCTFCDETRVEEYPIAAECEFPYPRLPDGWRVLDGNPICPGHKVTVKTSRKKKRS